MTEEGNEILYRDGPLKNPQPLLLSNVGVRDFIADHLDGLIKSWRNKLAEADEKNQAREKLIAQCYIDAYQTTRYNLVGKTLPKEETGDKKLQK